MIRNGLSLMQDTPLTYRPSHGCSARSLPAHTQLSSSQPDLTSLSLPAPVVPGRVGRGAARAAQQRIPSKAPLRASLPVLTRPRAPTPQPPVTRTRWTGSPVEPRRVTSSSLTQHGARLLLDSEHNRGRTRGFGVRRAVFMRGEKYGVCLPVCHFASPNVQAPLAPQTHPPTLPQTAFTRFSRQNMINPQICFASNVFPNVSEML